MNLIVKFILVLTASFVAATLVVYIQFQIIDDQGKQLNRMQEQLLYERINLSVEREFQLLDFEVEPASLSGVLSTAQLAAFTEQARRYRIDLLCMTILASGEHRYLVVDSALDDAPGDVFCQNAGALGEGNSLRGFMWRGDVLWQYVTSAENGMLLSVARRWDATELQLVGDMAVAKLSSASVQPCPT